METGDELFNFHLIRNWSPSQERSHSEVLSFDCNHVEGFQKSEKNWRL